MSVLFLMAFQTTDSTLAAPIPLVVLVSGMLRFAGRNRQVAFPFFGKKETRVVAKPPVTPVARAVPPAEPQLPPAVTAAPPPPSEFPDDYDLASLDFTTSGEGGLVVGNAHLQMTETSRSVDPAAEQAAMGFANGHDSDALKILQAAVLANPQSPELVWRMLFDLCQFLGQREAFESHGVDYAVAFEKSPPSWISADAASGVQANAPLISLSGVLSQASAASIEQLRRLSERAREMRIDVNRLKDADAAGGALLVDAIADFKRRKLPFFLVNAPVLVSLLEKKIQPGQPQHESLWLLLLEAYQQIGRHDAFEDLALNYAVTFEKSPPAWEDKAVVTREAAPPASARPPANALCGDVLGASADAFAGLTALAAQSDTIDVDCSALRRMDFVSAGTLLNLIMKWQASGKQLRFIDLNALVEGLFIVLGIDQIVTLQRSKKA